MDRKIKEIILIVGLVVVVFIAAFYVYKISKKENIQPVTETVNQMQVQNEEIKQSAVQQVSTVFIEGELVSFENNQFKIKNSDTENTLDLSEKVIAFQKTGSTIKTMELKDIKQGAKIKAEINTQNSQAISIEVVD